MIRSRPKRWIPVLRPQENGSMLYVLPARGTDHEGRTSWNIGTISAGSVKDARILWDACIAWCDARNAQEVELWDYYEDWARRVPDADAVAAPQPRPSIFDVPLMDSNESGAETIGEYLGALLRKLLMEGWRFNSMRPFGEASWLCCVYNALDAARGVDADEADYNVDRAYLAEVLEAIDGLFGSAPDPTLPSEPVDLALDGRAVVWFCPVSHLHRVEWTTDENGMMTPHCTEPGCGQTGDAR